MYFVFRQDEERESEQFILDGREVDIRFLLQSRATLKQDEISGTDYEKYANILKPASTDDQPFSVDKDLWKNVRLVRITKSQHLPASTDVKNDLLSALTVYYDEVEEFSRPREDPGDFKSQFKRCEVALKIALPEDCETKMKKRNFLRQLWDFAFALSTHASD